MPGVLQSRGGGVNPPKADESVASTPVVSHTGLRATPLHNAEAGLTVPGAGPILFTAL